MGQDEQTENLRSAVLVLAGLIFCETCAREANPDAPVSTDEEMDAQADKMRSEGWTSPDGLAAFCPNCSIANPPTAV